MLGLNWNNNYLFNPVYTIHRLKRQETFLRHTSVICLLIHIVFGCIIAAGCTSSAGKDLYVARLTYTASETALAENAGAVASLDVRLGYFASCITISTSSSQGSLTCSTNETTVLITDTNHFDQSIPMNVDLFDFMLGTGKKFRLRCLDPYEIVVSVILSFAAIVCFAFTTPSGSKYMYKYAAGFSYISFILTLAGAVWLETNITTATLIMNTMVDQYYSLSAVRGMTDQGLMWTSVAMQMIAALFMGLLGVTGEQLKEQAEQVGIHEDL